MSDIQIPINIQKERFNVEAEKLVEALRVFFNIEKENRSAMYNHIIESTLMLLMLSGDRRNNSWYDRINNANTIYSEWFK